EPNPVENIWQFTRDNWLSNRVFQSYDGRRSLLLCLEPPRRPAVDNHVHRPAQLGTSVLISGTWYKGGEHTRCETPLGSLSVERFCSASETTGHLRLSRKPPKSASPCSDPKTRFAFRCEARMFFAAIATLSS